MCIRCADCARLLHPAKIERHVDLGKCDDGWKDKFYLIIHGKTVVVDTLFVPEKDETNLPTARFEFVRSKLIDKGVTEDEMDSFVTRCIDPPLNVHLGDTSSSCSSTPWQYSSINLGW